MQGIWEGVQGGTSNPSPGLGGPDSGAQKSLGSRVNFFGLVFT